MISLLLAAALFQADPSAATVPPPAPPPAAAEAESDTPKGAPVSDYDFVAWCHGALTGHMALYDLVKPELSGIERPDEVAEDAKTDKLQMQAGREYLALYARALNGVDHDRAGALMTRRRTAEAQGGAIWSAAKTADPRTRMWSWLLWDLPGRCEIAAKRLETPAGRLAALHSRAPGRPGGADGPVDQPASIDAALTASTAPADAAPAGAGAPGAPAAVDASASPPAETPSPASASGGPTLRGPQ